MNAYRKKPVVIEAVQWTGSNYPTVKDFVGIDVQVIHHMVHESLSIPTLEGTMCATKGDYIIRGVKGEIYPCKPDIFAATYEPADAAPVPAREQELHKALREHAIKQQRNVAGELVYAKCNRCGVEWTSKWEEAHRPNCLVALPPPPAADK